VAEPVDAAIDAALYRKVCGHFATGVTIITASDASEPVGVPVGMAVNSFTSVSIDPPLVLFCAGKTSATWPRIRSAGAFTVNVLAADQEELSWAFASKDGDRFGGVGYRVGTTGSPILADVLAFIDCRIDAVHDAGDHELVVGRVVEMDVLRETGPLLFFRGGYADLGL